MGNLLAQQPSGKVVFSWFDDVYTYQFGAAEPVRLTNGARTDETSWSPDGMKIAFVSYQNDVSDIYVMNADGTNQTRVTNDTFFEGASLGLQTAVELHLHPPVMAILKFTS